MLAITIFGSIIHTSSLHALPGQCPVVLLTRVIFYTQKREAGAGRRAVTYANTFLFSVSLLHRLSSIAVYSLGVLGAQIMRSVNCCFHFGSWRMDGRMHLPEQSAHASAVVIVEDAPMFVMASDGQDCCM
jgi:hypothetical protein